MTDKKSKAEEINFELRKGYQPTKGTDDLTHPMPPIYEGYQPTEGNLDIGNPPQSGSGLPSTPTSKKEGAKE